MKWADSPAAAALVELLESEACMPCRTREFGLDTGPVSSDHLVTLPHREERPGGRASSGSHKEVWPWFKP